MIFFVLFEHFVLFGCGSQAQDEPGVEGADSHASLNTPPAFFV